MIDKSEKFRWLVRLGYFSRAILYAMLGFIALTRVEQVGQGTDGIFRAIEDFPAGTAILWLMVVGLVAYALFRLCSPLFDIENEGSDMHGWGKRIGHLGSAIGHLALAWSAYRFAGFDSADSGDGAREAAAGILSFELGGLVLGILGIAFFLAAISQAKKGITGSFMARISPRAPGGTRLMGGIGYTARAVVFAVIGWSLVRAGFMSSGAAEVKTLGDAVAALAGNGAVFQLVAIGLLVFGLFSLLLARYRIIPDLASHGRVPAYRS